MRAWFLVGLITSGCCGFGSFGGGWSSRSSTRSPPPATPTPVGSTGGEAESAVEAEAEPASPPPKLGLLALELGTDVAFESSFTHCSDPDGISVGVFGGVGLRPGGGWAGVVRGGALIGAGSRGFEDGFIRRQLWGGLGFRNQDRRIGYAITPFVTRSTYSDDVEEVGGHHMTPDIVRWGAGIAFDVYGKANGPGVHATFRFSADAHGPSGAFTLGYAFAQ